MKLRTLVLAVALVYGGAAHAGVVSRTYDFSNNQLPTGWNLQGPAMISNNRLEFTVVGNGPSAGLQTPIGIGNASSVTIEYDGHFSGNGYVSAGIWGYQNPTGATYGEAILYDVPASKQGYVSVMNGYTQVGIRSDTPIPYVSNGSADFHVAATFSQDKVSYSAKNLATGQVYGVSGAPAPYFDFLSNMSLNLQSTAYTGSGSGWLDNVKITAVLPPPKQFGLFIGVQHTAVGQGKATLNGDDAAQLLFDKFNAPAQNRFGHLLTGNLDSQSPIKVTASAIEAQLNGIKSQMNDGDTLVIYINGHGGSLSAPYTGAGIDGIHLGDALTDATLYQLLNNFDPTGRIRKEVFLDACDSGGFWGSGDPLEGGAKNLESLTNVALYASAAEGGFMYYGWMGDGIGYFTHALANAMDIGLDTFSASGLDDYLQKNSWGIIDGPGFDDPVFYQGDFGDPVKVDAALLKFFSAFSADFDPSAQAPSNVPEPPAALLAALALGILGLGRARTLRDGSQACRSHAPAASAA